MIAKKYKQVLMKLHCPNDQSLLETYLTLKFWLSSNDQSQPKFHFNSPRFI